MAAVLIGAIVCACTTSASQTAPPGGVRSDGSSPTPGQSGPPGLASFDEGGLAFAYPAAWHEFHWQVQSSFSNVIAYLATADVPEPCITTTYSDRTEVVCADRFHLAPNDVVVTVSGNGWPGFDMLRHRPDDATPLLIGGLPAYVEPATPTQASAAGADADMTWTLSRPGSVDNYYTVRAQLAGPRLDDERAEVAALIDSVRYDPPIISLPSDPGADDAAIATALSVMAKDSPTWRCFPTKPGVSARMTIASLTNGPDLAAPQLATCETRIERTTLQLWRLTLTLRLDHADPNAGSGETIELWVNPDGSPGAVSAGPIESPAP